MKGSRVKELFKTRGNVFECKSYRDVAVSDNSAKTAQMGHASPPEREHCDVRLRNSMRWH